MKARLTGKHFVPVFVLVILLLSAIGLWQRHESEKLEILASRVLDDGSSLQLARADGKTFEAYLVLVDQDGNPLWRKGIYRSVDHTLDGATVGEKIITFRAADTRGNFETYAFGRKDGAFLWRGGRIKQAAAVARPSERNGTELTEYYGPPVNLRLRLSALNGDVLARDPWPSSN